MTGRLEAAWGGLVPAPVDQWVEQRRAQGLPVIDLTDSCLARQGFEPPQSILEEISAATDKLTDIALYATHSFGRTGAREAIATLHRTEDPPPVESVALLPGSSFGYWALLRLIANPGDNILVPTPGYPLLDDIATLAGVRLRTYGLVRERQAAEANSAWRVDLESLEDSRTDRTRAMVVIGPHNPTGHAPSTDEWNEISKFCLTHNLPLICDEVFRNFWWGTENLVRPDPKDFPLLLTLDGLSKSFGLPGLKSGWVVLEGRDRSRVALLRRALEHLLDAFLAVSEQSQAATEALLKSSVGQAWRRSLAAQVGQRVADWGSAARAGGVEILVPLAGWHLIWPRNEPETENPADALRKETSRLRQLVLDHGIVVHSGTWYGLSHGDLVTTGLTRPTPALIRALAAG